MKVRAIVEPGEEIRSRACLQPPDSVSPADYYELVQISRARFRMDPKTCFSGMGRNGGENTGFLLAPSLFFILKTLVFIERYVGEWCLTWIAQRAFDRVGEH